MKKSSKKTFAKVIRYLQKLSNAKLENPGKYWSVDNVDFETAINCKIIETHDGMCAVKPDGDIIGLFKFPETQKTGVASELLKLAIKAGGCKLDNFDGYLTRIYEKHGFVIADRVSFDPNFAPNGWKLETCGCPDVVYMVLPSNI